MARVLIAPDKFKGSMAAQQVADSIARGMRTVDPRIDAVSTPVADGGEGTLSAALAAGFARVRVVAPGPTGQPVVTAYARRESLAVVEMADVCGLGRLPHGRSAPLTASSRGTGVVLAAALDAGCTSIVLGIGGSACTDGGAGLVAALGARLLGIDGEPVPDGGAALAGVRTLDLSDLHPRLAEAEIVVASDVDNPLTGASGAAAVYGPQKGASPVEVAVLEDALRHWADVLACATGADLSARPGAGAAGGLGLVSQAVLGGVLRPGIDLILELVGFYDQAEDAQLVVTGEGALDAQTLSGKAPVGVARAAASLGLPTVAVCGRAKLSIADLRGAGFVTAYALEDLEPDLDRCMADAGKLLEQVGHTIALEHLPSTSAMTSGPRSGRCLP